MSASTLVRKSVPVAPGQLELLDRLRRRGTLERAAVEHAVGPLPESASEAYLLQALLAFAESELHARSLDLAYAQYAAETDDEDRAFAAAVRTRRGRLDD